MVVGRWWWWGGGHLDFYLLTEETAAERWSSSRPECSGLSRCQESVLGQGAGLKERGARRQGLGLDLGLGKSGSPVVYGCGGEKPRRGNRDPKDGAKNCGRLKEKIRERSHK